MFIIDYFLKVKAQVPPVLRSVLKAGIRGINKVGMKILADAFWIRRIVQEDN
jgi:hypothetical protein